MGSSDSSKPWYSAEWLVRLLEDCAVTDVVARPLEILDPFQTQFDPIEPAHYYRSSPVDVPDSPDGELSVMTWNIKFGGGRIDFWYDGHGDRVVMEQWEVLENLEGVAAKIRQIDPDVLLIQEIDINSLRAANIDQMQWVLDRTALNFGAYVSQWKSRFIPTRGLGRVDMGLGVMSKYPIEDARRLALPEMRTLDGITRYFYLKRAILSARIDVPDYEPVRIVDTHTEAFSQDDTKKRQILRFKAELDRIDEAGGHFVAGGDLNTLPPESDRYRGFADLAEDRDHTDFTEERDWLIPLYQNYRSAVPLEKYREDNQSYCTFSSTDDVFWCRKLDYLFTNGDFVDGSVTTHQRGTGGGLDTMELSDHAPISASLALE